MVSNGHYAFIELASVSALATQSPPVETWMTASEQQRHGSINSEPRRRQFVAGRWLLRRLAAEVHQDDVAHWSVDAGADRIPSLRSALHPADPPLRASLSHSGDWLAAAIAPFPIGVDLECPSKARDLLALADAAFSPEERAQLRRLPERERDSAFYLHWTIKESTGKRAGQGLRTQTARRQHPSTCSPEHADVHSWQFEDISLAVAGQTGMSVRAFRLPDSADRRYWRIQSL